MPADEPWLQPLTLRGRSVDLVPLSPAHRDELAEAVRDGELWRLWYTGVPSPEDMEREIVERLRLQERGEMLPFAVIDRSDGRAAGMTTYLHIDARNRRLEIGATWYRRRVQRTSLNTQCKLLLLTHAFDTLACIAVEFRTHFFNTASRRGIERLGARLDGVLRQHMKMPNGTLRDTCVYSIIAPEWPVVRTHLQWQLDRPR